MACVALALPCTARAAEYYVAPTGSDTAPGTIDQPFKTVGRGQMAAVAGDTVFIRGGMYTFTGTQATAGVTFTKSGQPDRRINYFAYQNELPIFDLFGLVPSARVTGLDVHCNWVHIRGLEVRGTQQVIVGDSWGVRIQGSNNILERLNVHHNESPGVFITSGSNNLVLNCDSHHNYDPLEGGGNGDGFGCHSDDGGNVLSGCRSFNNSDDGFDFISAAGTCTAEKSWSFGNGWIPDTMTASGNGAGFKSGGFGTDVATFPAVIPRHTIRQNVAFGNRSQGYYANHHPGGIDFFNNLAFGNKTNFDMLADVGTSSHKLRNNIAMAPGTAISRLTGGTATFNSWTLPVTVSAADFQSTAESEALAPRNADGSLPSPTFMHLVAGSDLIDTGEDVGLAFAGTAPDLGPYESGLVVVTGTGGTVGGSGGRPGSGGAGAGTSSGGAPGSSGGGLGTASGGRGGSPNGSSTGGAPGSGGNTVLGSGGATPPGTGGASATGGRPGIPGSGGRGITNLPAEINGSAGCACAVAAGNPAISPLAFVLAALALLVLTGRPRRRRRLAARD